MRTVFGDDTRRYSLEPVAADADMFFFAFAWLDVQYYLESSGWKMFSKLGRIWGEKMSVTDDDTP